MSQQRQGVLFGVAAYGLWGLFPLYWPLLSPAGPVEILGHRVVWSLVLLIGLVAARRLWPAVATLRRQPGALPRLTVAAVVLGVNWGLYIWSVNTGHVVETSLGYFINPLVTVTLAVVLLRESLRRLQWAAVGLGGIAVLALGVEYGQPPWIALALAFSFATYGFLKKSVNAGAAETLLVETAVLVVPALGYLAVIGGAGEGSFGHGFGHSVLLAGAGVVTAIPLMCFGAAATRLPLAVIGLLQYLAPVLQFLVGVLVRHEPMPPARLAGFGLVWCALAVLTLDLLRENRPLVGAGHA